MEPSAPAHSLQSELMRLTALLSPFGLDHLAALRVGTYNASVEPEWRLPDLGDPDHAVVAVGSSRALWPAFLAELRRRPGRLDGPDPLDTWLAETVGAAADRLGIAHELRLSHEAPPRRFAAQRLAHLAGLAHLGPAHLSIHPELGPWIAIRAALVLAVPGPEAPPAAPDPCTPCSRPCLDRLAEATSSTHPPGSREVRARWRDWLAVRDACPIGVPNRYPDRQIAYHYTGDRDRLRDALEDDAS